MDLVDLGASRLDPKTNALMVQCKSSEVSDKDAPDYGELQNMCALGLTAKPDPKTAQGVVEPDVAGRPVIVGGNDTGSAEVYGDLKDGDTVLHGTGPEHHSQVRCQKHMVSIVTVDADDFNCLVVVDGDKRKIQIAGFGHIFEMSKDNGIVAVEEGGAGIIAKNGALTLKGSQIFIGERASMPVHSGPGAGPTSKPSLSVLVPP